MKNSKFMKKITLGSATVLSAFTLASAVAPTFTTTVHADEVTSVPSSNTQEMGTRVATPTYDVTATIKYDTTKVTPANETGRFLDGGYIQNPDGINWIWGGDNTEIPTGYEVDPNFTPYYRDVDDVFGMTSVAIRFYRPAVNPDTPAPSQNPDTPSAPTTDTPASTVEKTEEEAPTVPTAENVTPTSTTKEGKVADTNTKASTTQETSKEGTLPKAGDASLLSMLLGSTLLGGVSLKRFGKKNK